MALSVIVGWQEFHHLRIGGACSRRAGGGFLMRAILRTAFGGPEVLVIREIPQPEPKDGHAVIQVKAFGSSGARTVLLEPARTLTGGRDVQTAK